MTDKNNFLNIHFCYEIEMLIWAYRLTANSQSVEMNIKVETFLTHARALLEFFYDKKKYPDDARAFEFVVDRSTWESMRPSKSGEIENAIDRMNKELSHITYKRHDSVVPEKKWGELFPIIKDEIEELIRLFNKSLPNELDKINLLLKNLEAC